MFSVLLLIIGDMGIGKDFFVYVCYQVSFCLVKLYLVFNCVLILEDVVESELFGYVLEGKKGFFE